MLSANLHTIQHWETFPVALAEQSCINMMLMKPYWVLPDISLLNPKLLCAMLTCVICYLLGTTCKRNHNERTYCVAQRAQAVAQKN